MSNKVPAKLRAAIKELVYEQADQAHYLVQGRVENGAFLDRLAKNPRIREPLIEYMPEGSIRTYIKDAILNRYAKDKIAELSKSIDNNTLLKKKYGIVNAVGRSPNGKVVLYRTVGKPVAYIVVSEGTCLKWETALRKALEFVTSLEPGSINDGSLDIYLKCVSPEGPLSSGDKTLLKSSLSNIKVGLFLIEG